MSTTPTTRTARRPARRRTVTMPGLDVESSLVATRLAGDTVPGALVAGMDEVGAYEAAKSAGRLPLRMWQVLAGNPEGIAQAAWDQGLRPMAGDDSLRWGAVKVFADGSAGGLTAAFFEPYLASAGGGTGVFTFPDATIHALLKLYHEQGWQLDIHAIGDAAIQQVLLGMEA
uniref:amidohydrolase family protein n=1 Tax=Citricoccus sp. TaxID=1978372 RepID=UPI00262F48E5